MPVRYKGPRWSVRTDGYRSEFEARVAAGLTQFGVAFQYEPPNRVLTYTIEGGYTPDFVLPNGIIIEAKGWFPPEDKRKMRAVKAAHPQLDIRLVFQSTGRKGANLRWAAKYGFPACVGDVPEEWTR